MVSSISQNSNSLAYEMAQVSAASSLQSSSKIERLNYNGLSENEKESLRQKYASVLEDYNLDDIDLYEDIEEAQGDSKEDYFELDLPEYGNISGSFRAEQKEISSPDEISYFANKYAEISDEASTTITTPSNLNLSGYSKFNYNKIASAYAPKNTYIQSNVKVYA